MATYLDIIKEVAKPDGIPFARHAGTMSELLMSFRNDSVVQRLLKAGRRAAPLICWQLRKDGLQISPQARACLFWILCQTAPDMAAHLVMAPLASPTDHSAALLVGLAREWIPKGPWVRDEIARRGILHSGNDSWPYDALFPGLANEVKDDSEVKQEREESKEHPPNSAEAPLFATFAAHFAEASERFNPYNCESVPWDVREKYKLLIPITDGREAWFGEKGVNHP
ncbi:MAG TPA: hypothetical protein VM163_09530 [bacterium]|nr:hypothetical protein [bacterium]